MALIKVIYAKTYAFWHESRFLPEKISELLYGKPVQEDDVYEEFIWSECTENIIPRLIDITNKYMDKPYRWIWPMYSNRNKMIGSHIEFHQVEPEDYPSIVELKKNMTASDYLQMVAYYNTGIKDSSGLLEED